MPADRQAALNHIAHAENQARAVLQSCRALKSVLKAPPDPNPRHRANLLSWRLHEVEQPALEIVGYVERLKNELGVA